MGFQEVKAEVLKLPQVHLKFVFFVHFVLISWATLGNWALNVSINIGNCLTKPMVGYDINSKLSVGHL